MRLVRGILRGKIHKTMAVWRTATQASSSLPDEQRLCDLQEVTGPGAALCLVRPDKLHAARSAAAARFRRGSGSVAIMTVPVLRGRAREPPPGWAMRPGRGMMATGARQRTQVR
jgi:hypothetical protein